MSLKPKRQLVALDRSRLMAEVATRHGFLIREDDPAMALVTMNQLVLEQEWEFLENRIHLLSNDIIKSMNHAEELALSRIEESSRKAAVTVKEEISRDLERGNLHARELIVRLQSVYGKSSIRLWTGFGIVAAFLLLAAGVAIGRFLWH